MLLHRHQIRGEYKSAAVEAERTLQPLQVAADISLESVARMVIAEVHEMQINCVRFTHIWFQSIKRLSTWTSMRGGGGAMSWS